MKIKTIFTSDVLLASLLSSASSVTLTFASLSALLTVETARPE